MTETPRSRSPSRAANALAALVTTTILAGILTGGGVLAEHAWSANDAAPARIEAPGTPFGMTLAPLSAATRARLRLDGATGVAVAAVAPDSRAAASGLAAGDVIVKIADQAVATPSDVVARIDAAEAAGQQAVPLLVMRRGTIYYVALELRA